MSNPVLLHQWPLASASRVLSASDEEGLTTAAIEPGASNLGTLQLGARGVPLAAYALDLALVSGGLPWGYSTPTSGFASAALRYKQSSESSSQWRGYSNRLFPSYYRIVTQADSSLDFPHCSGARVLGDGAAGMVVACDAATDSFRFRKRSTRTGLWSSVTITGSNMDSRYRPDLVVLPSGRILAFAFVSTTSAVSAWCSDDDGATWSTWSTDTRLSFHSGARGLSLAIVGDAICAVTGGTYDSAGDAKIFWSLDGGQSFVLCASSLALGPARVAATANGRCILAYVNTTTGNVEVYPLIVGGGLGSSTATDTGVDGDITNGNVALCLADDGTLWVASHTTYPMSVIALKVSRDNGATWEPPGGKSSGDDDVIVTNNAGLERGWREISLGEWEGALVVTAVASCQTAAHDNALHAMDLGGWDSLAEGYLVSSDQAANTDTYGQGNTLCYIAGDYPENASFTRTDVGAGAARSLESAGLQVVSTAADNTYWTAPASGWSPSAGDVYRGEFYFQVDAGPASPTTGVCILFLSISDGANRQWIEFEFGMDQVTIRDTGGQIAASASVANQFTTRTELRFAFAHDYPSAGSGKVSAWYRIAGSTHWTQLADSVTVTEQAGSATESLIVGGTTTRVGGATWTFLGPFMAQGGGGFVTGWANPTSLPGRELSASDAARVSSGLRVLAYDGPGVQGDTFTAESVAQFPASNIWLNSRPSCKGKASDEADQNVVFSTTDFPSVDSIAVFGLTTRLVTVEGNLTNSWASPSFSQQLSAEVWQGTATTNSAGIFVVDGMPWLPHQFRSREGRRWFVEIGAPPGIVYEIDDNTDDTLFIEGLADTFGGATLRIFGDRTGVLLSSVRRLPFWRARIDNVKTDPDINAYEVGAFFLGRRHEMEIPYDNGFVDRWLSSARRWRGDAGYGTAALMGPERHELRLAWDIIDAMSTSYMRRLVEFFRAAEGELRPFVLWRDPSDISTLGLYTVRGPPARENAYGEGVDDLSRLAQLVLVEER